MDTKVKKIARSVRDGWSNILTALGIKGKDKRISGQIAHIILSESEVEELYSGDDIAEKVVNRIPLDGTKEWIELTGYEIEIKEKLNKELKRLSVKKNFTDAWAWGRLYGGAGLLIICADGKEYDQPLEASSLRYINNLILLSRYELQPDTSKIISDLKSPNFGMPEFYTIQPRNMAGQEAQGKKIHYSRIIRFDGSPLPRQKFIANCYWHDSVLSRLSQIISDYAQSNDSVGGVLLDFRQGVMKMKGLADKVAAGFEKEITDRLEILNTTRSILNTAVIDADSEDYIQQASPLTGVKDLLIQINNRLVAATDMPHTIILGESPSGLGATGQSEKDDYYAKVGQLQENKIRPCLEYLIELIKAQKVINFSTKENKGGFNFLPLKKQAEKEKAETRKITAETDQIYWNMGSVSEKEIRENRFGGEKYSAETEIDDTDTIPDDELDLPEDE